VVRRRFVSPSTAPEVLRPSSRSVGGVGVVVGGDGVGVGAGVGVGVCVGVGVGVGVGRFATEVTVTSALLKKTAGSAGQAFAHFLRYSPSKEAERASKPMEVSGHSFDALPLF